MPRPQTPRDRERAREQARAAERLQREAADRRRRRTFALVGVVLILAMLAGIAGALVSTDSDDRASTTAGDTTGEASDDSSTTIPAVGTAELPTPAAGDTLSEPTTCPAEDGSSPRVTSFGGPPPMCIDPTRFYEAILHTSKGELKLQLNPNQAPNAVNNFVVLARYHYYDGQPFTAIFPREAAAVRAVFDNPEGVESPGYTIEGEAPEAGQIFVPGSIAFIPLDEATDGYGGSFLLATFELAAGLPQNLTQFGIMLDGHSTLVAIDRAGSEQGTPAEVVTIDSVTINPSIPID